MSSEKSKKNPVGVKILSPVVREPKIRNVCGQKGMHTYAHTHRYSRICSPHDPQTRNKGFSARNTFKHPTLQTGFIPSSAAQTLSYPAQKYFILLFSNVKKKQAYLSWLGFIPSGITARSQHCDSVLRPQYKARAQILSNTHVITKSLLLHSISWQQQAEDLGLLT